MDFEPSPEAAAEPGLLRQMRNAITPRAFLVMVGVLLLQLAFALSYLGAFHNPKPHRIPVTVVAPAEVAGQAVQKLNALPGNPVSAVAAASPEQGRERLLERKTDAAFVLDPTGRIDTLMIASAGGPSAADAVTRIVNAIEGREGREAKVVDIKPPASGDSRGLSSFYLVLSWTIGGYLASSALNMTSGSRKPTLDRILVRIGAMAPYGFVSGICGALIVGPVLHSLPGAFWALAGIGTLVVFASGVVGIALQSVAGTVGLGITILLFTILGNPSSGGVYPASLLPPFWRAIGQALPPGAGTTVVRNTVYFDGNATAGSYWVLIAWAVGGVVVAILATVLRERRTAAARPATSAA